MFSDAEIASALSAVASIGATLAGFSSLAIAFGPRRGSLTVAQKLTVRVLIMVSLSAMLFALAPIPFIVGGVRPALIWTVGLAALAGHMLFFALVVPIDLRRRKTRLRWPLFLVFIVAQAAVGVSMALSAYGIGGLRGPAMYLAGLVWFVLVASMQLMFHIYQIHANLDPANTRRSQALGE